MFIVSIITLVSYFLIESWTAVIKKYKELRKTPEYTAEQDQPEAPEQNPNEQQEQNQGEPPEQNQGEPQEQNQDEPSEGDQAETSFIVERCDEGLNMAEGGMSEFNDGMDIVARGIIITTKFTPLNCFKSLQIH